MKLILNLFAFLIVTQSYCQSKEDFNIIKKFEEKPTKTELSLTSEFPNNPTIKLLNLIKEFGDITDYSSNDFRLSEKKKEDLFSNLCIPSNTDSWKTILLSINECINEYKKKSRDIVLLEIELEKRRDRSFEKNKNNYSYTSFIKYLDLVRINLSDIEKIVNIYYEWITDLLEETIQDHKLMKSKNWYSYGNIKDNFLVQETSFGKELYLFLIELNIRTSIKKSFKEYNFIKDDYNYKEEFKSFFEGNQAFFNERFKSSQRLKDGKSSRYRINEETTIDKTVESIRDLFSLSDSLSETSYLVKMDEMDQDVTVTLLRDNGYKSPYLDLMDFQSKLTRSFNINYSHDIKLIYENVIKYSHDYTWYNDELSQHTFYQIDDKYTENDIKVMKLIEESLNIKESDKYSSIMEEHNDEIMNPTPENCSSNVHKNTILKTQLYSNNGQRKLFSVIYQFNLEKSSDREDCVYIWSVIYNDLLGRTQNAVFRSTSDFSGKDNRIKIELFDFKKKDYSSPVYVKPDK